MATFPARSRALRLRSWAALAAAAGCAIAGIAAPAQAASGPEAIRIDGGPTSAADPAPVSLDADVYLPERTPASAVVLAHGFGGSKASTAARAQVLVDRGFVVVAYTARGFGSSTGSISMNSPDFEVADARKVIDYLATRADVVQDASGDPRVGFAGGSYGGALALLVAGYDERVDAIAADITWNDVETSLFGQSLVADPAPRGVFKQWWAGTFFSSGLGLPPGGRPTSLADVTPCGRWAKDWCDAFVSAAQDGVVTPSARRLMAASSPASITDRITVPTLIGAGQADSLFPFAQATANADQIRAADPATPVKVVWHAGGHDGGRDETERLDGLVADWMDAYLDGAGSVPLGFEVTLTNGALAANSRQAPTIITVPQFTGLRGSESLAVEITGAPQPVLAPPGGVPAAISSLPGIGGLAGQVAGLSPPGQAAYFQSEPITEVATLVGSPRVRLAVASSAPVDDVVLFAQLRVVSASGRDSAPQGLTAPIRIPSLGTTPTIVEVDLPAIATRLSPGDRLSVVVTTTDAAYQLPTRPAVYAVALPDGSVTLPVVTGFARVDEQAPWWLLGTIPLVALIAGVAVAVRPRTPEPRHRADLADVPVTVTGLSKAYKGGVLAVDDVTFTVPQGIVLGLLGPNGAGKTTTMRMLMGLIRPTAGEMFVYGERVHAGAPVLSRIGALVEGAGFLPHLSGRENLELFWRASGRSGDPGFDDVLEVAGLGHAVDRKVKSYSQGMRQRLGIAQAMLGRPDLLILDEPTNGLDPPQIREMRDVLHAYASTGRTVIVSSHLLAEVQMTCSHVVVMQRGRLIAEGEVQALLGERERLEDVFLELVGNERIVGGG